MQLSDEWINFLKELDKNGPARLNVFSAYFKDRLKAERLLGEIIRQGLVDLDENMTMVLITEKGRTFVKNKSK